MAKKETRQYKNSEHTRSALIDAAGKLAGEHNFNSISTRAIADLAGENLGSIHYHFGGKTELFKAVIDAAIAESVAFTAADAIAPYLDELDSPTGQAKAVRALIHRHIDKLFNPSKPAWHTKVIYQILQTRNELQDYIKEILIDQDSETQRELIKKIVPGVSDLHANLHSVTIICPIFFHATNMEFLLRMMEIESFTDEYLSQLEDVLTIQALMLFNLPLDKTIELRK